MSFTDSLWQDEYPTAQREFRHGPWRGYPPRYEWNAAPMRMHEKECPGCGYRYDGSVYTYKPAVKSKAPVVNFLCWNCWMLEDKPEEVAKFWATVDRNNAPPPRAEAKAGKIRKIGDGL